MLTLSNFVHVFTIPFFAWVSDRVGRRRTMVAGAIFSAVAIWPMFALFDSSSPVLVALAFLVGNPLIQASMFGPAGAYLSEMFEPTARYSGVSATYQLGSLLGAGLAPLVAQELVTADAGTRDLGLYIVAAYVVSGLAVWFSRNAGERRGDPAAAEPARTPVDA